MMRTKGAFAILMLAGGVALRGAAESKLQSVERGGGVWMQSQVNAKKPGGNSNAGGSINGFSLPVLIPALAAIAGSLVGGMTSFATNFYAQRAQIRRDVVSRVVADREALYSQFIREASKLYIDSIDKALGSPSLLIPMYSLIGQMRLVAGDKVLLAADAIADDVIAWYNRPPTKFEDVYKLVREGRVDPFKEFTEVCREERKTIFSGL